MVFILLAGIKGTLDFLVLLILFFWILSFFRWVFALFCSCYFCKRCVFIHLLHLSLALFTFGVLGSWEFLWRVGSYSSCVGLRCVECRAGTIYLSASLEWMAGLYRFSPFWLCCSGCGTVEMVGGWSGFLSFSLFCCWLSWCAVVCGRILFFYIDSLLG